jgi:alpha-methylacyl-CoA racemase
MPTPYDDEGSEMSGPLSGLRVVEMAGIGPGPFCAMLLADMGAQVIRIDRRGAAPDPAHGELRTAVMNRGRRSIALDLKQPAALDVVLGLVERADALLEGFRPGVMERLGLGPEVCLERNPRLVFGRMTGWGQQGPLAPAAGHDINYIALTGALSAIGGADGPVPPLNLVGDFGGGAMMLAFGIACALLEARTSDRGQVVDAAMVDGASLLMSMFYGMHAGQRWGERGQNFLDGAAPYYGCYCCADGKWVAVGAIEPQFYALLLRHLDIEPAAWPQHDRARWPQLKQLMAQRFAVRPREAWCALMEGGDACFAPVLDMAEAPAHAHNRARGNFVEIDGVVQPAPAPRFSRTPGAVQRPPEAPGSHTEAILGELGFAATDIQRLRAAHVI